MLLSLENLHMFVLKQELKSGIQIEGKKCTFIQLRKLAMSEHIIIGQLQKYRIFFMVSAMNMFCGLGTQD